MAKILIRRRPFVTPGLALKSGQVGTEVLECAVYLHGCPGKAKQNQRDKQRWQDEYRIEGAKVQEAMNNIETSTKDYKKKTKYCLGWGSRHTLRKIFGMPTVPRLPEVCLNDFSVLLHANRIHTNRPALSPLTAILHARYSAPDFVAWHHSYTIIGGSQILSFKSCRLRRYRYQRDCGCEDPYHC